MLLKTGHLIYVSSPEMWCINYKNSMGDVFHIPVGEIRVHKWMSDVSSYGCKDNTLKDVLLLRFSKSWLETGVKHKET